MRFAQVHKFAVYTLAVLGLIALGTGGELPPLSLLVITLGVIASWWAEGELLHHERYTRLWNVVIAAALAVQVARGVFFGTDPLLAIVEFAALLQVLLLANRRTARNYQQVTLLALLQLIAATVLGGGLSYALCFVGFVIATPWAMTLGHLRREIEGNYLADARAGRAGVPIDVARILRSRRVVGVGLLAGSSLLAVPIFLLTAVIFVLFPRIGLGILSIGPRGANTVAGFGTSVDLRGHGMIRNDSTIVLRVEPPSLEADPPPVRTFRLRGTTFDTYNGRQWTRRANFLQGASRLERESTRYVISRLPEPDRDLAYRVVLDPIDPPVVFTLEGAVGLRADARFEGGAARYVEFTRDRDDTLRYVGTEGLGIVYYVYVPRGAEPPSRGELDRVEATRERYLQLPSDLSPEVRRLAERVTAGEGTTLGKARAVERYLSRFRYTLELESGNAERPMEDFLFRTHAGHCEYFSTAMAVMLRTVGVPTRNVTGFLGGAYNRFGRFYAVHQGDAHSWVEVFDARQGWVTFEPTPAVGTMPAPHEGVLAETDALVEAVRMRWRNYVVAFDLNTQARLALRVWRFLERHHGNEWLTPTRWTSRRHGARAAATASVSSVPWRRVGAWALVLGALAVIAWQARGLVRLSGGASRSAPPTVRAAQELARALDQCLAARGHARPPSRSPLAFAREVAARGEPFGALTLRVAERYMEARFGGVPLGGDELTRLRAELHDAPRAPAA